MIPYGRQSISQSDIDAVISVLNSDWLTQGPVVPKFEQTVADYCGAGFGIAVNSATSALHIACLSLDVGPGDLVWVPANTFVATANCALYCGADVDFIDIDSRTYNMSVECLREKLVEASAIQKLPKVVIPVHFAGQSCDMREIHDLSKIYGFKIIEDASHAIGGRYLGNLIGGCQYSEITVFSFHPVKIVTSGEGGMALTNDSDLSEKMARFRSHGITSKREFMRTGNEYSGEIWNYQQIDLGYNYRMSDIHAALGLSQLAQIDDFVRRRQSIADLYDQRLIGTNITLPFQDPNSQSSRHLYPILTPSESRESQKIAYDHLTKAGVGVNLHYIPVYRQPFFEAKGFRPGVCPKSEMYFHRTISLPIYFSLSEPEHVLNPVCRSTCYEASTVFSVRHLVAYSTGVR